MKNLQIAVESSLDRVERADFTGMMVPFWSFSRYELILRGFVSDIDQNHGNLDFNRLYAIKFGKTQITLVLEGFRTNQMHHSNWVGEADFFSEKIQKVSIILIMETF